MFAAGDLVVYGIHGVCRITALEERTVDRKAVRYYVLEPQDQPGSTYLIPTENPAAVAKLRPMLSERELRELLSSPQVRQDAWIADENQRKQAYRELITGGDRAALIRMVGTLRRHRQAQKEAGRKFHLCDENFLRDAEKLLSAEFSQVLGIPADQVGSFIQSALQEA